MFSVLKGLDFGLFFWGNATLQLRSVRLLVGDLTGSIGRAVVSMRRGRLRW
jgi:hypothetical protein